MTETTTEADRLNSSFDETGIAFHSRSETLAALKATGTEITYAEEDGKPYCRFDGEYLPLADALTRIALDDRSLADGRTLPRSGVTGRASLASKADLKSTKEKSDFITKFGFDAYQALPLTGPTSTEVKTQEDFLRLPPREKSRRYGLDPNCFANLPREPKGQSPLRGKTHHAALAQELATRGARPR